jgi:hypothetical protein
MPAVMRVGRAETREWELLEKQLFPEALLGNIFFQFPKGLLEKNILFI